MGARGKDVAPHERQRLPAHVLGFPLKACNALGITQAFTSYNNPKGNADTERMMRTLKEELVWLREWTVRFSLSKNWSVGFKITTPATCIPRWATNRPSALKWTSTPAAI
jgi:hypothetical protein